jgi:hypothetical protein
VDDYEQTSGGVHIPSGLEGAWADEFAEQFAPPEAVNSWLNEWEQNAAVAEATTQREGEYVFAANNPFLEVRRKSYWSNDGSCTPVIVCFC